MAVTVRLFAALREAAGTSQVEVEPDTVPAIIATLCDRFGEPFATRVAVASGLLDGQRVALDEEHRATSGSELALLPPFSGGSTTTSAQRRIHRLLLTGSLLVPGLLVLGVASTRWAFGLVVVVLATGCVVDLHSAFGSTSVRTVLPATLAIGVGPAVLLLLAPATGPQWISALLAVGVMGAFVLALASSRRHDTAMIVGATMLAALLVAIGTGTLVVLRDALDATLVTGALTLIALTDIAVIVAGRPMAAGRIRYRLLAALTAAVPAAVVLYTIGGQARVLWLVVGFAVAAVIAALLSARLREVLRGHAADQPPALLIGTADAVLLGIPLATAWLQILARR